MIKIAFTNHSLQSRSCFWVSHHAFMWVSVTKLVTQKHDPCPKKRCNMKDPFVGSEHRKRESFALIFVKIKLILTSLEQLGSNTQYWCNQGVRKGEGLKDDKSYCLSIDQKVAVHSKRRKGLSMVGWSSGGEVGVLVAEGHGFRHVQWIQKYSSQTTSTQRERKKFPPQSMGLVLVFTIKWWWDDCIEWIWLKFH